MNDNIEHPFLFCELHVLSLLDLESSCTIPAGFRVFMYYPCWIRCLHVLSLLDSESSCTIPAGFRVFMYYPCWIQNLHVLSLLDSESSCTIPAGFSVFMYYPCWIQSLYVLVKKNLHCSVLFVLSLEMGIVFVNELIFFVNNGVI